MHSAIACPVRIRAQWRLPHAPSIPVRELLVVTEAGSPAAHESLPATRSGRETSMRKIGCQAAGDDMTAREHDGARSLFCSRNRPIFRLDIGEIRSCGLEVPDDTLKGVLCIVADPASPFLRAGPRKMPLSSRKVIAS